MADVLIIEDDTTLRETLEISLRSSGFKAVSVSDGRTGLLLAKKKKPGVVLLDVMLPKLDGFSLCEHLRSINQEVVIIMLTALSGEPEKLKGFSLGADDYVTKPFSIKELTARINAHLKRAETPRQSQTEIIEFGDIILYPSSCELTVKNKKIALRPKEYQLLLLMAQEPAKLFTREYLGQKVWGYNFIGSSRTIDVHIQKLRKKIESCSDYKLFTTAYGLGYKFDPRKKL